MAKRTRKPKRRGRALAVVAALLLMAAFVWWGNTDLMTAHFTFSSPRLPEAFEGYRIVQLSDLHGTRFGENNERLLAAVAKEKPDLIALTGDLVDKYKGYDPIYVDELTRGLTAIAPTYFITGNHEWAVGGAWAVKDHLTAAGVHVLANAYTALERDGQTIYLAGIDDPNGFADQKKPDELAAELREAVGNDAYWILLAHRSDRFETEYAQLGADLTISGHAHGGIIRLPFTDGLLSNDRTLFPSYTAGFYTAGPDQSWVFVSRGLGNSDYMLRLFNRPEIAVLTLMQGNSNEGTEQ